MKIAVVYASKTGFSKKYANWIKKALNADIYTHNKVTKSLLKPYDIIIYGGGLYASGIYGFKNFIRKYYANQALFVYATGASPGRESVLKDIFDNNFKSMELDQFKFYYLRGGFNYKDLNFKDKILMRLLKSKLKHKKNSKKPLTGDEKGMLKAYDTPVDLTKEKFINPLVEDVKNVV